MILLGEAEQLTLMRSTGEHAEEGDEVRVLREDDQGVLLGQICHTVSAAGTGLVGVLGDVLTTSRTGTCPFLAHARISVIRWSASSNGRKLCELTASTRNALLRGR